MARKPTTTAETSTELALFTPANPVAVVTDQAKAEELFAHIEQQIAEFVPDLSTDTGRRAIASLAFKVSKTKTAITAAAEELIEAERKKVAATVTERKRIEDRLDGLRDLARKPLTEWEEAEAKRVARAKAAHSHLANLQFVQPADTAGDLSHRIVELETTIFSEADFGEDAASLGVMRNQVVDTLMATKARLEQAEKDRAELEELRAEKAEKARQAAEAEAERQRQQEEAEAAQRAAGEATEAAETARLAAEADARRIEEAAAAAQIAERQRADQALEDQRQAHQAELDRIAEESRQAEARRAEEQRIADEAAVAEAEAIAKRQADQAHRTQVKTAAKNAIMSCGADEQTAKNVVLSIVAGEIPNVTINF